MSKKKILIEIAMISKLGAGAGGRETWLSNFLNEIYKKDSNIDFYLTSLSHEDKSIFSQNNYSFKNIKGIKQIPNIKKIPVSIGFLLNGLFFFRNKKIRPDVVIAVGGVFEALYLLAFYIFRRKKPYMIAWLRTIYSLEKGSDLSAFFQRILLLLEKILYKNFYDLIISNGKDTASFYKKEGISSVVIPNAIDFDKWAISSLEFSGKIRVAFIGRLTKVKGIDEFLDSVEEIMTSQYKHQFEFIVVGDGDRKKRVEDLSSKGLLSYLGSLSNNGIPKILHTIDCCVALTLKSDSFGGGGVSNALLEQMASGRVIVAWDNDIFRQVLDENAAYFVSQGSSKELCEAYVSILKDLPKAKLKASYARKISQSYSISSHVNSFLALINRH